MPDQNNQADMPEVILGITQAFIFMAGAVVYGIVTVLAGSALLWALYFVLLISAVVLSFAALPFPARKPKPRWIKPLASVALIVAIIFGAAHTALVH